MAEEEVSTTSSPAQKVKPPSAVIIGVAGTPGSVNVCTSTLETQLLELVNEIE